MLEFWLKGGMARALRIADAGAFDYVTCRGNERRDIVRDHADRVKFLRRLEESLCKYGVFSYNEG